MVRRYPEKEDVLIDNPYLNDYLKITQSGAFRRLAYKTQVLSLPENPHVRSRLVHTEEVLGVSLSIAESLGLDMNLCMAIASGHDIGHAPYGHLGEEVLTELGNKPFSHNVNSVTIAQHIERRGHGLNLSHEVLSGMLRHSLSYKSTNYTSGLQEHSVVMFADKIAYTFSDLNDALRYGYLEEEKIPRYVNELGTNQRERVTTVVNALIRESRRKGYVSFEQGRVQRTFMKLRSFLFRHFYRHIELSLLRHYLRTICNFFDRSPDFRDVNPIIATSLLTDREVEHFVRLLTHSVRPSLHEFEHFGLMEILPYLRGRSIDYADPDLKWGSGSC